MNSRFRFRYVRVRTCTDFEGPQGWLRRLPVNFHLFKRSPELHRHRNPHQQTATASQFDVLIRKTFRVYLCSSSLPFCPRIISTSGIYSLLRCTYTRSDRDMIISY